MTPIIIAKGLKTSESLKNHIMELYEIPLLRFMTNGSGEKEKIIEMLDKLVG